MKNLIAFFEIPATDFQKSVDFYQAVFGTQLLVAECGDEKMACFAQDGKRWGLYAWHLASPPRSMVY